MTIYRLADGMGGAPGAGAARGDHRLSAAPPIDEDWPAMAHGGKARRRPERSTRSTPSSCASSRRTSAAQVVMAEVLYQLDQLTQARRARLVMASGIVPGIVWVVLFFGAFVTIGFTFFFGTENLRAQTPDDRGAGVADLLRSADHHRHRPPVRRDGAWSSPRRWSTVARGREPFPVSAVVALPGRRYNASVRTGAEVRRANENGGREAPRSGIGPWGADYIMPSMPPMPPRHAAAGLALRLRLVGDHRLGGDRAGRRPRRRPAARCERPWPGRSRRTCTCRRTPRSGR